MFLVNSRHPLVCAPSPWLPRARALFSRSYEGNLPSSFSTILSSALESSSRPPESVCGTVGTAINSAGDFLGSMGLLSSRALSALLITSRDSAPPFVRSTVLEELPTGLNRAIHASDQLPFSVPPAEIIHGGAGILTCFPSPTPFGLGLGTD